MPGLSSVPPLHLPSLVASTYCLRSLGYLGWYLAGVAVHASLFLMVSSPHRHK